MEQQMEVFLQENTVSFIESLFKTLVTKEYLEGPPKGLTKKLDEEDEEGKPDSTTSTPANIGELTSDLREAEHRSGRRTSDVSSEKATADNSESYMQHLISRRIVLDEEVPKRDEQVLQEDDDHQVTGAVIDLGQDHLMEEDVLHVAHLHIPAVEGLDQDRFRQDVVDHDHLQDGMRQGAPLQPMKMTAMLTRPQHYQQHPTKNSVAGITTRKAFA